MKTKVLLISGIATASVLAGGWALAQTQGHGRMQHQGQGHQGQGQQGHRHGQMHGQMQQKMQQKMQQMHGKHQPMTQGQGTTQPGTTQPGTTPPRAAQPQGNTGGAHQH